MVINLQAKISPLRAETSRQDLRRKDRTSRFCKQIHMPKKKQHDQREFCFDDRGD